jgi:hypothetical protein
MNFETTEVIKITRKLPPVEIIIDKKQQEILKYSTYLGSLITNDARCKCKNKPRISTAKVALNKKKTLSTRIRT